MPAELPVTTILPLPEVAHHMALIPVVWLTAQRETRRAWWWLAAAFGISWLADWLGHWVNPWTVGMIYPVSQAAIIGAVLLNRDAARVFVLTLAGIAAVAVLAGGAQGPDWLLRSASWGSVAVIAWNRPALGILRLALLVSFGLGLVAWIGYSVSPGWETWGVYQTLRAVGLILFCWAAVSHPKLRIA